MDTRTNPTPVDPVFIDDKGVALLMSGGRSTVWALTKSGVLPQPIRIGRRTLWDKAEVVERIRGLRAAA